MNVDSLDMCLRWRRGRVDDCWLISEPSECEGSNDDEREKS